MPFCRECGADLREDARFCSHCGTAVAVSAPEGKEVQIARTRRRPRSGLAFVLIGLLIVTVAVAAFVLLPVRVISADELRSVPYQIGVSRLNLVLNSDVADVNVAFEDMKDKLVTLSLFASGGSGIIAPSDMFNFTFNYSIEGEILNVTSGIRTFRNVWPQYSWLNIMCDVRVNSSLVASLEVKTDTGKIRLATIPGVAVGSLKLEAAAGDIQTSLVENVTLSGTVRARAVTGKVGLSWQNIDGKENIVVDLRTITGKLEIDVEQEDVVPQNATLRAETTTGEVDFSISIGNNVGAIIESDANAGSIHVVRHEGFLGPESRLGTGNYPAISNVEAFLKSSVGEIRISAKYAN